MFAFVALALGSIRRFLREEVAQDAFEYVLVIGVVVVAVLVVMTTPVGNTLMNGVIDGVCNAVDSLTYVSVVCP